VDTAAWPWTETLMTKNYAIRLRCPHGDHDEWMILEDREESLENILHMLWDFECQLHGVLREMPIEAREEGSVPGYPSRKLPAPQRVQPAPTPQFPESSGKKKKPRSSERLPLHVAVVLYGWTKSQGSIQEETSTLLVNASGALLTLKTKLDVGDTAFLINKASREEQEIRVVYVEQIPDGKTLVGVALKYPSAQFWKKTRRNPRIPKNIRVIVKGVDRNGHPFVQSSYTVDISKSGARLEGLGYLTEPGETIEVKRPWRGKARFRVIWIGQIGMEQSNQIGISSLEEDNALWGGKLPESETPKPGNDNSRRKK
jgi:hypothetical protein